MEACLVNLLEPGDKIVAASPASRRPAGGELRPGGGCRHGNSTHPGDRLRPGPHPRDAHEDSPQGAFDRPGRDIYGALQPIDQLGKLCHEFGSCSSSTAVTSLGCVPVKLDEWEIDAVYSCTQKGLGCPPGLSPVSFSPRAAETISKRKTKVQSWYLDMKPRPALLGLRPLSIITTAPSR